MKSNQLILTAVWLLAASTACGADWITEPSYFTHDPKTGNRVTQYSPVGPVYVYHDPTYRKSGFHHFRSSIRVNGSADNMIIVEEFGRKVRPYGEWQRPFRPYSVPYNQWGPQPLYNNYYGNGFGGGIGGPAQGGFGPGGFPPQANTGRGQPNTF